MIKFFDRKLNPVKQPLEKDIDWRISAYGVIRDKEKILVIVPMYNPLYELPGGGVEINENVKEAISREFYEETGYKIKVTSSMPIHMSETYFYAEGIKKYFHSINLFHSAELLSEKQNKEVINTVEKNEIREVKWIDIKDLNKNNCHHIHFPIIEILKKKDKSN